MKQTAELTCINCPMGCALQVVMEGGRVVKVSGNNCSRGYVYGAAEVIRPVRTITTTLPLDRSPQVCLSVKTSRPVDKTKIRDVMKALKGVRIAAPVKQGQVLIPNILQSGADIVSCQDVPEI